MAVPVDKAAVRQSPDLVRNVVIGEVSSFGPLDPDVFLKSLTTSLSQTGLLAGSSGGDYIVSVEFLAYNAPILGFDMTYTTAISYIVRRNRRIVFDEVIEEEFTANFNESLIGARRGRIAFEGAMRENINSFIRLLTDSV